MGRSSGKLTAMKAIVAATVGAFGAAILAWLGWVLIRPEGDVDKAFGSIFAAFVAGGLAGVLIWRRRARRDDRSA